jgi:trans-aconitate methyltransferase
VSDRSADRIAEQIAYYRARAPEYEEGALDLPGGGELDAALDDFRPTGHILELACGPGTWTDRLLRSSETLTALDASPEMLALTAERIGDDDRLRLVQADVFEWRPDREYDVVFFGFWLSHVPMDRFDSFWSKVASCLGTGGRVFFVDDAYRTPEELIEGEASPVVERTLSDGRRFRAVKVPHTASYLERRLGELGWRIAVHETAGPFYWGSGSRA